MDAFLAPSSPPQDSGYGPSGSRSRRTGQTSSEESGPLVPVVSTRYRVAYPDLRPCPVECLLGPDPEIFVRHGQDIRDGANTILAEHGLLDGPRCFAETNMEQIEGRPGTEEPTVTIVLPWLPDSKAKWTSAVQAIAIRNKELLQDTEFEDTPPRIEITAPEIVGPIYLGVVDDRPYLLQHWDHIKRVVHERLNTFDATRHFVTSVILLRHGLSPNTATNPITVYISVDRRSDEKQWDSILTNIENSLKALGWTDIRVHLEHNSPCLLQFQLLDPKGERGEILSKISKNNLVIHGEYHDNVNLGDDVSISQYVDRDDGETCNPPCGTLGCYLEIKTKTNPQWTKVGLTNYHNVRPGFQGWTIKEVDGGSIIGPPSSNSQLLKVDQNGWLPGTVGDPTPFESPSRIKHNFTVWDLNQRIQDAKDTVQEDPSEGNVKDLADLEGELKRKIDFFNQNNQALGPLIAASGYGRRSVNNHRLDWALIQVPEHRQGSNRLPQKGEWTKYNHHSLYRPNAKTYGQPLKTQGRSMLPLENRPSHLPSVANVWKLGTTTRLTAGTQTPKAMSSRSIFVILLIGLIASFVYERINLIQTFYQNAPSRITKVNNIGKYEVKFQDQIRSCEDVLLIEKHHLAILACDPGRERHNTVMGIFAGNVTNNAELWAYDYTVTDGTDAESLKRIKLAGFPHASDFHTLGMAFDLETSNLFVVSHAVAGSRIELFNLDIGSLTASYIQTIQHPLINAPNSIASVNGHEFYITNDHYITKKQSLLLSNLETYLGPPTGTVVHVNLKASDLDVRVVAWVPFANGIEILNSSTVAVASSSRAAIYMFNTSDATKFKETSRIKLPFLPDNLSGSGDKLMIAGHGNMPALAKFTQSRRFCNDPFEYERADPTMKESCVKLQAISWVSEWSESEGLKHLYVDTEYPSSSTAVKDAGKGVGIISGLYAKGILIWRDEK